MIHIVLLNGPPSSGKDTVADALQDRLNFHRERFSYPIKRALCAFFDVPEDVLEPVKDEPCQVIPGDITYRQAQISISEDWAKPKFGREVFGRLLADRMQSDLDYVIPDSGFEHEFRGMERRLAELKIPHRCLFLQLHRGSYNFDGDSRSYWDPGEEMPWSTLYNDGDVFTLQEKAVKLTTRWLGVG